MWSERQFRPIPPLGRTVGCGPVRIFTGKAPARHDQDYKSAISTRGHSPVALSYYDRRCGREACNVREKPFGRRLHGSLGVPRMTHILIGIALAILLLLGRSRRATRGMVPPERSPDPAVEPAVPRMVRPTTRQGVSSPSPAAPKPAPAPLSGYLLDSHHSAAAEDATTAMMDMMAGPGVCTPRGSTPS